MPPPFWIFFLIKMFSKIFLGGPPGLWTRGPPDLGLGGPLDLGLGGPPRPGTAPPPPLHQTWD